jgi:DNA-binding MarR family transcriptional regulator
MERSTNIVERSAAGVHMDAVADKLLAHARLGRRLYPRGGLDGLEPAEIQVLVVLWRYPERSVNDVAELLQLRRPSASNALAKLQAGGLVVEAVGEDARVRRHRLTSAGRRTVRRVLVRAREILETAE